MATEITDNSFEQDVLKSTTPVLVDFWAPWCGPCRAIAPILEDLATELAGKVSIVKLNVDDNPKSPAKYGVRAIPTIILFKNGELVDQMTGAISKTSLEEWVSSRI